jgi:putative hydrolase of the HAD superfamily
MGGTLLDLGYDKRLWEEHLPRRVAENRGIALEDVHRCMRPIFAATAGTLDWYCIDCWSRALAFDVLALKRATRHQIDRLPPNGLPGLESVLELAGGCDG